MYNTLVYLNTILGVWDDLVGYYIDDTLHFTWCIVMLGSFSLLGGIMLGDSRMTTSFIFIRWPAQPRNSDVAIFQISVFNYFRAVTHAFYLEPNFAGAEYYITDFSIYALYCLYGVKEVEPGLLVVTYGSDPQTSTWQPMSENLLYEKQALHSWCWAPGDATNLTEDNWKAIKYVSANYSNSMLYCVAFIYNNDHSVLWMYASSNLAQLKECCKRALSVPGTLLVRRVSDPSHLLEHYYL